MITVTKQTKTVPDECRLDHRIVHIFSTQVRQSAKGNPAIINAPYVLDLSGDRWFEAVKDYAPDSTVVGFAKENQEDSPLSRWVVGDFLQMTATFAGEFDWVLGDHHVMTEQDISYFQLIDGGLRLTKKGGWFGLYLPLNYIIHNPRIHNKRRFTPKQLWVSLASRASNPHALHLWQAGSPFEQTKIEWFE